MAAPTGSAKLIAVASAVLVTCTRVAWLKPRAPLKNVVARSASIAATLYPPGANRPPVSYVPSPADKKGPSTKELFESYTLITAAVSGLLAVSRTTPLMARPTSIETSAVTVEPAGTVTSAAVLKLSPSPENVVANPDARTRTL